MALKCTYLLPSVARKYTSSGASIQLITCLRPDPVRVMWAIFGLPLICAMCRGKTWPGIMGVDITFVVYCSGVRFAEIGSLLSLFAGGPVNVGPKLLSPDNNLKNIMFYITKAISVITIVFLVRDNLLVKDNIVTK